MTELIAFSIFYMYIGERNDYTKSIYCQISLCIIAYAALC